jgi:hypothetical protein
MTHKELETAYLALCQKVQKDGMKIVGKAGAGYADAAGIAALALVDHACDCRQQYLMQLERAAGYDLAALQVHADTQSNSETGWERDDD